MIGTLLRAQIPIGHVRAILHLLRAVLLISDDVQEPITTFHKSFRDFLDKTRSGEEFCVDPDTCAVALTDSCPDLSLVSKVEMVEMPQNMNPAFMGMALDYARVGNGQRLRS